MRDPNYNWVLPVARHGYLAAIALTGYANKITVNVNALTDARTGKTFDLRGKIVRVGLIDVASGSSSMGGALVPSNIPAAHQNYAGMLWCPLLSTVDGIGKLVRLTQEDSTYYAYATGACWFVMTWDPAWWDVY